jgi:hypothetical protein
MKTFAYYYKNQTHPEPIGKVKAIDSEEAIINASITKRLSIDKFLQLFEIKEYDRGTKEKNGNAS